MTAAIAAAVPLVRMYKTEEFPCAYLPGRLAAMYALDPQVRLHQTLYSQLVRSGFRRSGEQVYIPHCRSCQACIPLRIPVDDFLPSRSQRRVWRRNQDLQIHVGEAGYSDEHFELFRAYVDDKHRDGGMDKPRIEDYLGFLLADGVDTRFIEFRYGHRLVAVAVTDQLDDGWSAVYTFYDMRLARRSLGVFTLLWQIEHCRQRGLERLYLGYWIEACRKMRYKQLYRPCQILTADGWQTLA
jgi:arginyl-tRNA--protein-N-Asp/Glu arginylyltransferase